MSKPAMRLDESLPPMAHGQLAIFITNYLHGQLVHNGEQIPDSFTCHPKVWEAMTEDARDGFELWKTPEPHWFTD